LGHNLVEAARRAREAKKACVEGAVNQQKSGRPDVPCLAFTFVDKSDSGHNQIAVSNFAGAAAGGFVGNFYLPPGFNNLSHGETRTAFAFGTFAGRNLLRECSPELPTRAETAFALVRHPHT
jgi:hypothetical protein